MLCGMTRSARNRLEGNVAQIEQGGVMAHVVRVGKSLVESAFTKRSVGAMKWKVGTRLRR